MLQKTVVEKSMPVFPLTMWIPPSESQMALKAKKSSASFFHLGNVKQEGEHEEPTSITLCHLKSSMGCRSQTVYQIHPPESLVM